MLRLSACPEPSVDVVRRTGLALIEDDRKLVEALRLVCAKEDPISDAEASEICMRLRDSSHVACDG